MSLENVKASELGPLHSAAILGDKETLKGIFKNNANDVNARDKLGRTPLMFSIMGDHHECVELLLQQGARPDNQDITGRNALYWAIFLGHVNCIKILLSWKGFGQASQFLQTDLSGTSIVHIAALKLSSHSDLFNRILLKKFQNEPGNVNALDENNQTPLHWAASVGNHKCVAILLKSGANVEALDNERKTPLHLAVCSTMSNNNINKDNTDDSSGSANHTRVCVAILIQAGNHLVNWKDYDGRTPLHFAVANSESETLTKAVLDSGFCNINIQDKNGCTALHYATQLGKDKITSLLLEKGALSNLQDINGATPVHYAVNSKSVVTMEVLMRHPDVNDTTADKRGRTGLMWAAGLDEAILIQVMCRHGADPNLKDDNGDSALHLAIAENHVESANSLIHLGSDLHLENHSGQTPLFTAAMFGHSESLILLLSLGAKTDHRNHTMNLPIHVACRFGHPNILQILLNHHSSDDDQKNEVDIYGRTSLIYSASGGYLDCIKILLDRGADINMIDHQGMNGLHWGVVRGHLDVVRLLIEHNAFLSCLANLPHGKIHDTFMPGWKKKQKTFWEKNQQQSDGTGNHHHHQHNQPIYDTSRVTPLDIAILCKESEIAQLLIDHGGFTFQQIKEIAAIRIQTFYRRYQIKSAFEEHKELQLKHERLKASKLNNINKNQKQNVHNKGKTLLDQHAKTLLKSRRVDNVAGSFLGEIVSESKHLANVKNCKNKSEE